MTKYDKFIQDELTPRLEPGFPCPGSGRRRPDLGRRNPGGNRTGSRRSALYKHG